MWYTYVKTLTDKNIITCYKERKVELSLYQKQKNIMSAQMINSAKVLQMSSQELLEYINANIQENPMIDIDENYINICSDKKASDNINTDFNKTEKTYSNTKNDGNNDPFYNYRYEDRVEDTLMYSINEQLIKISADDSVKKAVLFLAQSLNKYGWLEEDIDELSSKYNYPKNILKEALIILQSFEPSGIGGYGLKGCLQIQLMKTNSPFKSTALKIVNEYLEYLAKYKYAFISKELNCDIYTVKSACELIKTLNPKPADCFFTSEKTVYIVPDILSVKDGDSITLTYNSELFPKLKLNEYYFNILKSKQCDNKTIEYLSSKYKQAKNIIFSIEHRSSTVMECAKIIFEIQRDFFLKPDGVLVPMTLNDISNILSVHQSTVSRAIKDKYIQCSKGVYPLSYFFTHAASDNTYSENEISSSAAKQMIKNIIENENPQKPYSDQKICSLLENDGCLISRRTVAKYREELNIPSASYRKYIK